MKLASYHGTQDGYRGIANGLIRFRLGGRFSHTEMVFEPGDGVNHLMPDGSTHPVNSQYWCASSVATDTLPPWSPYRAGRMGGVRFKRIWLNPDKWTLDDVSTFDAVAAATWANTHQGMLYDWQLILGFIAKFVPEKTGRVMCSEACAEMLGLERPWSYDPCSLPIAVRNGDGQTHLD